MSAIRPESAGKKVLPLKNPRSKTTATTTTYNCGYCRWYGVSAEALEYHINHYHEAVVAREGEMVRKGGRDFTADWDQLLIEHGYHSCKWVYGPCPGPINPNMQRVCEHLDECPYQ